MKLPYIDDKAKIIVSWETCLIAGRNRMRISCQHPGAAVPFAAQDPRDVAWKPRFLL